MPNLDQLAAAKGLRTYDTALPQEWVDRFAADTGFSPVGHFVWSYDEAVMFGAPVALTPEGEAAWAKFDILSGD